MQPTPLRPSSAGLYPTFSFWPPPASASNSLVRTNSFNAAQALDAADGVMDGRYFGAPIVADPLKVMGPAAPTYTSSPSLPMPHMVPPPAFVAPTLTRDYLPRGEPPVPPVGSCAISVVDHGYSVSSFAPKNPNLSVRPGSMTPPVYPTVPDPNPNVRPGSMTPAVYPTMPAPVYPTVPPQVYPAVASDNTATGTGSDNAGPGTFELELNVNLQGLQQQRDMLEQARVMLAQEWDRLRVEEERLLASKKKKKKKKKGKKKPSSRKGTPKSSPKSSPKKTPTKTPRKSPRKSPRGSPVSPPVSYPKSILKGSLLNSPSSTPTPSRLGAISPFDSNEDDFLRAIGRQVPATRSATLVPDPPFVHGPLLTPPESPGIVLTPPESPSRRMSAEHFYVLST